MTDSNFLVLNGTEAVWVVPRHSDGSLGAYQWITTTQNIANLGSGGNATDVNVNLYNVTTSDGLLLVNCTTAGGPVVITLLSIVTAPRPISIKKTDTNREYPIYVETADNSVIEFNSAGIPYQFSNPGECHTFDPRDGNQYWVTN